MNGMQNEFVTYVIEDVLGDIPGITSRAMFGGYGIYRDGIIFSLIAFNQLYFKRQTGDGCSCSVIK